MPLRDVQSERHLGKDQGMIAIDSKVASILSQVVVYSGLRDIP